MAEDKAIKEASNELLCASCRYVLTGLDPDSVCPECGFSIAWSRELAEERLRPGDELPRIRLALLQLLASTMIGIPAIAVFALLTPSLGLASPARQPDWLFWGFQGLLLLGSALPVLTLSSLPSRARVDGGIPRTVGWAFGGILGIALMNGTSVTGFVFGSALAVVSAIINLTCANRSIGSVVPAWARLGAARQTRGPLIAAVALIGLGRITLEGFGPSPQFGPWGTWVQLMTTAVEALLLIGCIYLFFNRLWLCLRLWRSMRLTSSSG
ncbi:MAG: hypothetical protein VX641_01700 [Planctomycetota bacterium]|nr:hypothetical protein [Planctomycetota bacterium]